MHQAADRQLPEARHPFVDGMVVFEVLALQVFAALPPIVEPDEEPPDIVLRAFSDHEAIAGQAAGLVDQGRGGRPAGLVEHGVVQRRQDPLKGVRVLHDDLRLFSGRRSGTNGTEVRSRRRPPSDPVPALAQPPRPAARQVEDPGIRTLLLLHTAIIFPLAELLVNDRKKPPKYFCSMIASTPT